MQLRRSGASNASHFPYPYLGHVGGEDFYDLLWLYAF